MDPRAQPRLKPTRRHLLLAAPLGLFAPLLGCNSRPGVAEVNEAIAAAPGVTGSEISVGPGGGLGSSIMGSISFDVPADRLREGVDEAWRHGVQVLHQVFEGARGNLVQGVSGITQGKEFFVAELVDLGDSTALTIGHFYDRYGIG
ncbi:hypothetical protein [Granulicoccus phenolivorans]|uniref:hypothetical protein n=1 Tax=Granulicoccus phenolivorans TaxID=266854 RepID=UPI001B7FB371|nr:hypothetical protein [Granulicoccus phenolivorans]